MTNDELQHVMKSFAIIAPGFAEWRQKTLRSQMQQFAMDPKEAASSMREAWTKPLERYSMEDIQTVLEDMESGRIEVPSFGNAPRVIAKHCRDIVNERLGHKRNQRWKDNLKERDDSLPSLGDEFRRILAERKQHAEVRLRETDSQDMAGAAAPQRQPECSG